MSTTIANTATNTIKFTDLGLSEPLLKAVRDQGYDSPSPIQAQAIPAVLAGRDVMAAAQTGTGKTAGFTLPLLEKLSKGGTAKSRVQSNNVRALVLTPTRELAAQVSDSIATYGKYLDLHSTVVFGGVKINPQMMRLRQGVDVLVATPGRLMDLYNQNAVKFSQLEVLILDEADRMLDMGFIHDIKRILKVLPKKRQNLMFSATFSDDIRDLAKGLINDPVEISVTPRNETAKTVEQWIIPVDQSKKSKLLIKLIKQNDWQQVLVFSRTKHGANRLTKVLESKNISAADIHGNKSQGARTKALAGFKDKSVRVLVATDIAARGIDIDQLPQVVNFDLPQVAEDYVHRIGRTGRAGANGKAVSLVSLDESKNLNDIEQLIQQHIKRVDDEEFAPSNPLPASREIRAPKKKSPRRQTSSNSSSEPSNNRSNNRNSNSRGDSRNSNSRSSNSSSRNSDSRNSGSRSTGSNTSSSVGNRRNSAARSNND
jgi:ATP-dependent RNA helicase RhlE